MVVVELAESGAGPEKAATVTARTRLLDLCDDVRGPVRFGCRAARCTTCRVEVLEGGALLEGAGAEEAELLASIEAPSQVRLACQAVIREGAGRVRLRWLGPLCA
ncbi:MAG: 2Fe-2S iron-sulfur cluster-binding protein [Polyangiaceae bacterium]